MAVTQYIGARYVPLLADPLEWDNTRSYEPLTIVTYQGDSYTSRQYVPVGMSISNESYWAQTGNYDGQVEAYRQETQRVSDALSSVESTAGTAASDAESALAKIGTGFDSTDTVRAAVDGLSGKIGTGFDSTDTVRAAVDGISSEIGTLPAGVTDIGSELGSLVGDIDAIETTLTGFDATHQVKAYVDTAIASVETQLTKHAVFIGDSFSTTTFVSSSNRWCYKVARAIHMTPHIYADNGAGFLRQGNNGYNFNDLAGQAASDSSFTNSDVHYVIVLGGLNDLRSEYIGTAFTTGVQNVIDTCRTAFPNAQIVICGVNAWSDGFTWVGAYNQGNLWAEIKIQDTIRTYAERVSFVGMSWCLGFNENLYSGNPPHPNSAGHIVIANWILSYLFGSGIGRSISGITVYGSDNTEVGVMTIHARADVQEIVLNLTDVAGASNTIHDDYNILGENQFIIQGLTLNTSSITEKAFVGVRQSTGIKTVYYGYGRLTRVNC